MNTTVLYHDNCPDGFTAAWAAWLRFGDGAMYIPVLYGQEPPWNLIKNNMVFLLDITFPRPVLDSIAQEAVSVTILDHHKTAQADLEGWNKGFVVFDMSRSGAGITWDVLHDTPRPTLVNYIEDRDLWKWTLPDSRAVNEYIFSYRRNFQAWNLLSHDIDHDLISVIRSGHAILEAKNARVEQVCQNTRWIQLCLEGISYYIPVVNTSWDFSEIGEYLCTRYPQASCGGYYFDRVDKRQWGFRSRGDFDVGKLCCEYGGGGHKNAAGFTSPHGWFPERGSHF